MVDILPYFVVVIACHRLIKMTSSYALHDGNDSFSIDTQLECTCLGRCSDVEIILRVKLIPDLLKGVLRLLFFHVTWGKAIAAKKISSRILHSPRTKLADFRTESEGDGVH